MRLLLVLPLLLAASSSVDAFSPSQKAWGVCTALKSTVEAEAAPVAPPPVEENSSAVDGSPAPAVTAADINARLDAQMEKLKQKDATSTALGKEDITVVYEDEHIVVVDKPSGILCVPGNSDNPSLNQAVFEKFGCESDRMDKMVVHRLGMDTSGLVVFARTDAALREMNTLFRTRSITRQYEALLCGHVDQDEGIINLPLMRDYEFPPYMRISTDEHQRALIGLDSEEVGKKLLEQPKESITKYDVIAREDIGGHPVTRVSLTSISGRTHQLNVHCAGFGHPIVGDKVYGLNGDAAPNGGLDEQTMDAKAPNRASLELQKQIADEAAGMSMCVHARSISFRHPLTKEQLSFESKAPF